MKKYLLVFSAIILMALGAQAQSTNVNSLNAIIDGIVKNIVAQDSFFEDLSLIFDPSSDFDNNYVSVELSAASRSVAWTQALTSLAVNGSLEVKDMKRQQSVAMMSLSLTLNTDVYAFSKHAVATFQSSNPCPSAYDMNKDYYEMGYLVCEVIMQAFLAGDFKELKSNVAQIPTLAVARLKSVQAALKAEIANQGRDSEALNLLESSLENVEGYLDNAAEISVFESDEDVMFTVNEQPLSASSNKDNWSLSLTITEEDIAVALYFEHFHKTGTYDTYVGILKQQLSLLEQNDPATVNYVSSALYGYLEFAKSFLTY